MNDSKKSLRLKALSIVVITLLTVALTFGVVRSSLGARGYSDIEWRLNDEKNVLLPYYGINNSDRNYIVLTGTVPSDCEEGSFIGFFNRNGKYEIIIDGKTVNIGGFKIVSGGKEVPVIKWNKFPIDGNMRGKEISFRFYLKNIDTGYSVDPIIISDDTGTVLELISRDGIVILADVILAVSAVMILIIAVSSKNYVAGTSNYVFFSIFALLFSLWILTDRSISYYFISGESLILISYLSLALAPIPFALFVRSDSKGAWRTGFNISLIFGAFLTVFLIVIFVLGRALFLNTLTIIYLYILVLMTYTVIYKLSKLAANDGSEYYSRGLGIAVFAAFCLVSLLEISFFGNRSIIYASAPVIFGFLIYSVCIFIELLHNLRSTLMQIGIQRLTIEETKTQLVLSQIKPHFIYNSLGAIRVLIKKDPDKAYDALYKFTRYLRQNIDVLENAAPVPFKTEIEHIDTYVEIEKLRFSDKIEIEYNTEFVNFSVPPLSIQIFVENAIKHGIFQKKNEGLVRVSSYLKGNDIYVVIEDNGVGFDTASLDREADGRKSVGMKNAVYRIEKTMGGRCEIESKVGIGTTVTVIIPRKKELGE